MASVFKRGGKANRNGYYYVQWYDANGMRRTRCAKTNDRDAAQQFANQLEAKAMMRREGIIDSTAERLSIERRRPIEDALRDFEAKMLAAARTAKHVEHTLRFIREAVSFAKWEVIGEIEADGAARFSQSLRDLGRSARTIQSYLVALKSFTRWLVQGGKLAADPLAGLKRPSPSTDRRHERRALLPEEWHQLEGATRTGKVRYGMEGGERALLYRLGIETGLRAGELRSLTRACLRLDETPPCVVLKAKSTKNRKDARQFILPEMAEALREHVATKAPNSPLFKLPHPSNIVRMLRADLAEARRRWLKAAKDDPEERLRREQSDFLSVRDHSGHLLDFHSLRHSTGTWLSQSGVHPKTVQTVMRHGAITLTLDTYGHLLPGQECDAVGQLGHLLAPRLEAAPESMAATGTEGKTAESAQHVAQHLAQQWGGGTGRGPARGGERGEGNEKQTRRVNPCRHDSLATSGEPRRGGAEVSLSGLEPETYGLKVCTDDQFSKQKTAIPPERAALGAAVGAESGPIDPELSQLIAAWPVLPEPFRRGILAMVQAAGATLDQQGGRYAD